MDGAGLRVQVLSFPLPTEGSTEGLKGKVTGRSRGQGMEGGGDVLPEVPMSPCWRGAACPSLCPSTDEVTAGPFSLSCLPGALSGSVLRAWSWEHPEFSEHLLLSLPPSPAQHPIPQSACGALYNQQGFLTRPH